MNEPTPHNLSDLAGAPALANTPMLPLHSALSEHESQIAKLGELVQQLAERLAPLRNVHPQAEATTGQNVPSSSPVVDHLLRKTEEIKYLQGRISEVLQDLEV